MKSIPWILLLASLATLSLAARPAQPVAPTCQPSPLTARLLADTRASRWLDQIEKLSGEETVMLNGRPVMIETRFTEAMQANQPNAQAIAYVLAEVQRWVPSEQVTVETFTYPAGGEGEPKELLSRNIVVTFPGQTRPQEEVLLTAHLDSSAKLAWQDAPGADDNASGSAALLEAARVLAGRSFERTIRLVWFTAEEQGLHGSRAYATEHDLSNVVGVVNMDMIAYDSDNDRCFEIHAGELSQSQAVGQCVLDSINHYNLDLAADLLVGEHARGFSDHGPFWEAGIGAVGLIENALINDLPDGGCLPSKDDFNPFYHSSQDTVAQLNPATGFAIAQAGLAAVADLAAPLEDLGPAADQPQPRPKNIQRACYPANCRKVN
jgi:leucyl aminopeptidase